MKSSPQPLTSLRISLVGGDVGEGGLAERHFDDKNAYRRDRRKDELLKGEGCFVLRFLAEDVMSVSGTVIDRIVRQLPKRA